MSEANRIAVWEHCCPGCGAGWHVGGFRRCPECGRYGHSLRAEDWRLTDAYRAKHGIRERAPATE